MEGFEGPLDFLIEMVRRQRVDLGRLSILTLTDQLAPEEFPPVGMAAAEHFAGRLSNPWLIEELCLVEEDADGFFQVRGNCRLGQQH